LQTDTSVLELIDVGIMPLYSM